MLDNFTEDEKKLMLEVTNHCLAEQYGTVMDAEGNKALIITDSDPMHMKKMSRSDLLEALRNDAEFNQKYKAGYYSYLKGRIVVASKVLWSKTYTKRCFYYSLVI